MQLYDPMRGATRACAAGHCSELKALEAAGVELFPLGFLSPSCRTAPKSRSASARPGLAYSLEVRLAQPPTSLTEIKQLHTGNISQRTRTIIPCFQARVVCLHYAELRSFLREGVIALVFTFL